MKKTVFGGVGVPSLAHWLNCITGWDFDGASLLKAGTRIFTVKRLYNNRLGISRKDDILPERHYTLPIPIGAKKGLVVSRDEFDKGLDRFYEARGWDNNGIPTGQKLKDLGLDDMI